jgi:hypothetical protein
MLATAVAGIPGRRVQSSGPNSQSEARKPLRERLPVTNLVCKLAPIIQGQKRQCHIVLFFRKHPRRVHFPIEAIQSAVGPELWRNLLCWVPSSSAAPARPWPVAIVSWFVSSSSLYLGWMATAISLRRNLVVFVSCPLLLPHPPPQAVPPSYSVLDCTFLLRSFLLDSL